MAIPTLEITGERTPWEPQAERERAGEIEERDASVLPHTVLCGDGGAGCVEAPDVVEGQAKAGRFDAAPSGKPDVRGRRGGER